MLLRRLLDYAEAHEDQIPPPFHATKPVRWVVDLGGLGGPMTLIDLADPSDRTRRDGVRMLVPSVTKTSGIAPTLAVDTIEYVFGWVAEGRKPQRVAAQHEAFRTLVDEWVAADPDGPGRALQAFYSGGYHEQVRVDGDWAPTQLVAFRNGNAFLHESPSARRFWSTVAAGRTVSGQRGLCLVCGRVGPLLRIIPLQAPARLFPGATQSVSLVSVNKTTHGFDLVEQLVHTPICVDCGLRVMAALEAVLSAEKGALTYPEQDGRMAWWTTSGELDLFDLFTDANPQRVREFLASIHRGRPGIKPDLGRFCSVVVAGNVTRAIVRSWIDMPLTTTQDNLARWFEDHAMIDGWTGEVRHFPVVRLARATGRWKPGRGESHGSYADFGDRAADHPHGIFRALAETALVRKPLPPKLLSHLMHRVRTDGRVDAARAALVRLALRRRPGITDPDRERYMATLNEKDNDPAYVAGRLFAVLEGLQSAAGRARGDERLNVTFADRYFARAVSNPRLALVTGRKNAQAWLKRLHRDAPRLAVYFERQLDDLFKRLDETGMPYGLPVAQQAAFILGYHHQQAHRWTSSTKKDSETTADTQGAHQ